MRSQAKAEDEGQGLIMSPCKAFKKNGKSVGYSWRVLSRRVI